MEVEQMANVPALDLRWTFSNALSALRLLLVVPAALSLAAGMRITTAALFVIASLTDVLDGYMARRLNEVSDLGKILDPLADKVFIAVIVIEMLALGMLPLWFVAIVVARDLLILSGGIAIERKSGVVLPSNYPGKGAVVVLSVLLLWTVLGIGHQELLLIMTVSLVLLAISTYLYGRRAWALFSRR